MNERIHHLVNERLSDAVECPAKTEIIEELVADLCEKYDELIAQGHSEEEAYAALCEGMDDLDEVVAFINEGNRRQETSTADIGGSLHSLMQELGANLGPGLREVAEDLRTAAIHARDAAIEAKGPISEMGKQVGKSFRSAVRSVNMTYGRGRNRYDTQIDGEGVRSLDVQTVGGDVVFGLSEDEHIYVVEHASVELPEDKRASIELLDGTLRVRQGRRSPSGRVFFSYGAINSDYEIYLPRRTFEQLAVVTVSGDVDLDEGRVFGTVNVQTMSGDVELPRLQAEAVSISTVSGEITVGGDCGELHIKSTSGEVELAGVLDSLSVKTVSGDVVARLDGVPVSLALETVSGDGALYLPENDGFTLRYSRVSGELRSDFPLMTSFGSKNGTAVYRDGSLRDYTMKTVSGAFKLGCR